MEEARLDKESQSLMQDLKQLTMKDGLRRQYHIDYTWDDNIPAKKACQELFGPPGSQYKESEMLSRDLQHTSDDTSLLLSSTSEETKLTCDTTWKDVTQEEDICKPGAGRVLNRLLKQIDAQRQQNKNGSQSESNLESKVTDRDTVDCEEEPQEHETMTEDQDSETESKIQISGTTVDITEGLDKKGTIPKAVIAIKTAVDDIHQNDNPVIFPTSAPNKNSTNNMANQTVESSLTTERSSYRSKSQSELLLENSLQHVRNDEVLLKSVKDFQQRLLQQHKSSAKIQEQINCLESKRAAIDAQVDDVIKK